MNVFGIVVDTPEDAPWGFAPDWRNGVAKAIADASEMRERFHIALCDGNIRAQHQVIRDYRLARKPLLQTSLMRSTATAFRINSKPEEAGVKARLEALLLCGELTYAGIAKMLALPQHVVHVYERVYYNIRDNAGMVSSSPWLREFFATKGQSLQRDADDHPADLASYWKLLAFEGGYNFIAQAWKWPVLEGAMSATANDELKKTVIRELEHRVRTGNLGSTNLVMLYNTLNPPSKEGDDVSNNEGAVLSFFMDMVKTMTPTTHRPSKDEMMSSAEALAARVETMQLQSETTPTMVSDIGVRTQKRV